MQDCQRQLEYNRHLFSFASASCLKLSLSTFQPLTHWLSPRKLIDTLGNNEHSRKQIERWRYTLTSFRMPNVWAYLYSNTHTDIHKQAEHHAALVDWTSWEVFRSVSRSNTQIPPESETERKSKTEWKNSNR